MSDAWEHIKSFGDAIAAEVLADELRGQGVPAEVVNRSHLPGADENVSVQVPKHLTHRAKWIMKSLKPTAEELTFEATGQLGEKD